MSDPPVGVSRFSVRRPWVLINRRSRIGGRRNPTTAETWTSGGFIVSVSFELADPPGVSQWSVHCPGQDKSRFDGDPLILSCAEAFVLLVICFTGTSSRKASADYFVYRAGPGTPQLDLIPIPYPRNFDHNAVGILPLCDGASDCYYAVVIPVPRFISSAQSMEYKLRVFWSESQTWTAKKALLASDSETNFLKVLRHEGTEVISLGTGLLGWVDLWWGILVCNVLDKNPLMRLIQWPVPEPRDELLILELDHLSARPFRDVNVVDGFIKFVELRFHKRTVVNRGVINKGWTATVWNRMISSAAWHEGYTVVTDDISIIDSVKLSQVPFVLPEIFDVGAKRLTWDRVMCSSPTLSLTRDDVVYMLVKVKLEDPIAFLLAVNVRNKTLEALEQCCAKNMVCLEPTYKASVFSGCLGTTVGSM